MTYPEERKSTSVRPLLERHRAFWEHRDEGPPLVRVRRRRSREPFENVDVTPEMIDVEALTPEVGTRDLGKRLVQDDLFYTECPFSRIPWMEAIVGCEIHSGANEAMWPRPALGPGYEGIEDILHCADQALANTLGAAAAVLRISLTGRRASFAGIGNIELHALSRSPIRPVCIPGIVGRRLRKVRSFHYQLHPRDLLVLFSDGISSHLEWDGFRSLPAQGIAEAIVADFGKDHDDATCVVVRL